MVHIGPKEHFFEYIGVDTETGVEYGYCDRCKGYRADGEKITRKYFLQRQEDGKVKIQ